jgi:hypothetical protein
MLTTTKDEYKATNMTVLLIKGPGPEPEPEPEKERRTHF